MLLNRNAVKGFSVKLNEEGAIFLQEALELQQMVEEVQKELEIWSGGVGSSCSISGMFAQAFGSEVTEAAIEYFQSSTTALPTVGQVIDVARSLADLDAIYGDEAFGMVLKWSRMYCIAWEEVLGGELGTTFQQLVNNNASEDDEEYYLLKEIAPKVLYKFQQQLNTFAVIELLEAFSDARDVAEYLETIATGQHEEYSPESLEIFRRMNGLNK